MKIRMFILPVVLLIVGISACSGSSNSGPIEIQDAWVRVVGAMDAPAEEQGMGSGPVDDESEPMPETGAMGSMIGSTGAAFMTIKNTGQEADKLVAVASDVADAVEIHLSAIKDDIMSMRQVDGVEVPPGGEMELKPGSYHIMLIGLNQELAVGDQVSLKLTFEKTGQVDIEAEVRAMP